MPSSWCELATQWRCQVRATLDNVLYCYLCLLTSMLSCVCATSITSTVNTIIILSSLSLSRVLHSPPFTQPKFKFDAFLDSWHRDVEGLMGVEPL
jgi:hypothetical protein